jgi:hypothetical protein
MKVRYTTRDERLSFELEAGTAKELFNEIASVQEVFDAESCCGLCGSVDIRFVVREAEGKGKQANQKFTYYELRCNGILDDGNLCRGRFDFGQSLDTKNLFPKRKADEGEPEKGPRGWYRYVPQGTQPREPEHAPAPAQPKPISTGTSQAPATSPETQALYDRFAAAVGAATAPTRLQSCMDLAREVFAVTAGKAGRDKFDEIFRAYQVEHRADAHQHGPIKGLLKQLWEALEVLRQEVHA